MSLFLQGTFQEQEAYLDRLFHVKENFDIVKRRILVGERSAVLYFVDGMCQDATLEKILEFLLGRKKEDLEPGWERTLVPYGEVDFITQEESLIHGLLSGVPCLFLEGEEAILAIDCRTYPSRSMQEPEKDKVMRGSRDGFVETLVFNTALIRRRIRSEDLRVEMLTCGKTSKTDLAICYMNQRVNQHFLKDLKTRIQKLNVDALTMNQETLGELLYGRSWINPFPKFRYTERPDTTAASILEGCVIILVDTSPAAMILPTTIRDLAESADDYYFPPITGHYLRWSRILIGLVCLLLTPTWLLFLHYPAWVPEWLSFAELTEEVNVPILLQLLILEFAIDGLRLASLSTPSMLSTPLSIVAGIVLGDYTVSSGWFNSQTMLYMAFVTIANYSLTSFELGYALKFMRLLLLVLTGLFGVWGYGAGIVAVVLMVVCNRTIGGKSYLFRS